MGTPSPTPSPVRSEPFKPPLRPGAYELMELSMIYYCQDSIMRKFQDGRLLTKTIQELRSGHTTLRDIPTITVVLHEGRYYSVDNRRLRVFKEVFQSEKVPVIVGYAD